MQQRLPCVEVKSSHNADPTGDDGVKKLHDVPLAMAKAKVGEAVSAGIGDQSPKAFGHEGRISGVCSGKNVPDYMARIYLDPDARRRYALSLLRGDPKVRTRFVVEIEE